MRKTKQEAAQLHAKYLILDLYDGIDNIMQSIEREGEYKIVEMQDQICNQVLLLPFFFLFFFTSPYLLA